MRTLISVFSLFALSLNLSAQQSIVVTPKTLAGWMVTSTDHKVASELTELTLPASAQAAHSFDSSAVTIKLTSNPVVGTAAADWPVLEIGNCDLVFARSETGGSLLLIIGENQPIDLPFSFALDETGRSTEPLAIEFSRQGSTASVTFSGQNMQFPAGPQTDQKLDVVASSGATQAWDFKMLEVVVGAPTEGNDSTDTSIVSSQSKDTNSNLTGKNGAAKTTLTSSTLADGAANAAALATKAAAAKVTSDNSGLEIFTPPAVRHARIDAVRAVLSGQK